MAEAAAETSIETSIEAERFLGARVLAIGQTLLPLAYFAGVALPYLFLFTLKGVSHCGPPTGCQAPGDVMEGPWSLLAAAGGWATALGLPMGLVLLVATLTYLGVWRRVMPPVLRGWLAGSAGFVVALMVFQLTPPGQFLFGWVVD